ncbi:MAG: hypothetical protein JWQ63_4226 [Mucilaginibacter sp.]|nr:hypothetical protein [Mucilaginibacter sp.]
MKKSLLLLVILIGAVFSTYAQNNDATPKISVGFSVGGALPPASNTYPLAGGIAFKFEYPVVSNRLNVIITTGYTYYVTANGYSTGVDYSSYGSYNYSYGSIASFIPVEIGAKLYVFNRLYIEGDAGVSFYLNSSTNRTVAPIVSPSVGYTIPFGHSRFSLDLGVGYESRIEAGDNFSQVAFRGAFNFGL